MLCGCCFVVVDSVSHCNLEAITLGRNQLGPSMPLGAQGASRQPPSALSCHGWTWSTEGLSPVMMMSSLLRSHQLRPWKRGQAEAEARAEARAKAEQAAMVMQTALIFRWPMVRELAMRAFTGQWQPLQPLGKAMRTWPQRLKRPWCDDGDGRLRPLLMAHLQPSNMGKAEAGHQVVMVMWRSVRVMRKSMSIARRV